MASQKLHIYQLKRHVNRLYEEAQVKLNKIAERLVLSTATLHDEQLIRYNNYCKEIECTMYKIAQLEDLYNQIHEDI